MKAEENDKRKALIIRPYARLLTMLGEQLLKNQRVALVELIKNSYDADADWVEVEFQNFGKRMNSGPVSRIVVRDNGCGMTLETIRTAWMNPATPSKFLEKKRGKSRTPGKNRVLQGEKGIGRFAVLKLAKKVTVTTRPERANSEILVTFDFTRYDNDFFLADEEEQEIFLDELQFEWSERDPKTYLGRTHGTTIEMDVLKGDWNETIVDALCRDVANLTDPVSRLTRKTTSDGFDIRVICNGERRVVADEQEETLKSLIEDKAVLSIQGGFIGADCKFRFNMGTGEKEVSLYSEQITGLWIWRQHYEDEEERKAALESQEYRCGDFQFQFYIFDFARGIEEPYLLTQAEKNLLKEHRIYLYRDGIRVYPYGDADNDWLNIDVSRGRGRAGHFFSNDQIVGWIDITQKGNPGLRDKTNREGLIETGGAAQDFLFLVPTFLSFIKQHPFGHYQQKQRRKNQAKAVRDGVVAKNLATLQERLQRAGDVARAKDVAKIEREYKRERDFLSRRADLTEDLAGVGLSVEMASHDIMLLMARAQDIGVRLARDARQGSLEQVQAQADMLVGVLHQIVSGMRDVQSLFTSSRRRRRKLRVEPILDKIHAIYASLLERLEIEYTKSVVGSCPLVANTTDGVLMQVLINLFDNAAYWLDTNAPSTSREIRVVLDGDRGEIVFGDSGPGVDDEDRPYIFEAFFSGKGQEGRGLGLYIARQLLERYGYGIDLAETESKILAGANFVVDLVRDEP